MDYMYKSGSLVIGAKIKERRKFLKMTQRELADAIAVTFQQVQKYENGQSKISMSTFILICSKLRVNPEYFFDSMSGFREDMEPLTEDENLEKQLLSLFRSIENKQIKARIIKLVEAISSNSD